jgi:hypothetical protein
MALSWTDVTEVVKTKLLPVMEKRINYEDFLSKWVESHEQVENTGNNFKKTYKYSFSEGTGMLTSVTGQLETAGKVLYKTFTGNIKWRNGVVKIYETIAELMNADEKAFVDEITSETEGLSEAMKAEKERMNFGDGGVTQLATVASATDASPSVITLAAGSTTKYLRPGMPIDFLTAGHAAITNGSALTIQDIIDDTSFTVDLVVTGATRTTLVGALANSLIYHKGGYLNEFHGLKSLIGSTANIVNGVDRSTAAGAWYRPQVKKVKADGTLENGAATGTPQDPNIISLKGAISVLTTQQKAKKENLYGFAPEGVVDNLVNKLVSNQQYITPAKKIDLWPYDVVSIFGVPMLSGNYSPDNTLFLLEASGLVKFLAKKLGFSEMDGNMWKWVANYAAYTAYVLEAYEFGHYRPWQCMTIYDMKSAY